MGHFFTWRCYFADLEGPFWVPGTPLRWCWGPGGHPMDTLRGRCPLLSILGWIWGASWDPLWVPFCDFLWFGMAKLEMVSRSMFLVIRGWKWCQNAMAACAITIVKTKCFEWFCFFYLFTDLMSWGKDLDDIFVFFGDPGGIVMIFKGPGDRLEMWWFLRGTLEEPGLRAYTPAVIKSIVRGPTKQLNS